MAQPENMPGWVVRHTQRLEEPRDTLGLGFVLEPTIGSVSEVLKRCHQSSCDHPANLQQMRLNE